MAKLVAKNKLKFKNGRFYYKNNVVSIDPDVVDQLNQFEYVFQAYEYLENQGEYHPEPTLDGFEFKHARDEIFMDVSTPLLDSKIQETKVLMAELDAIQTKKEINKQFNEYADLLDWVRADEVVVSKKMPKVLVDTKRLGNPLKLDIRQVCDMIAYMASDGDMYQEDDEKND